MIFIQGNRSTYTQESESSVSSCTTPERLIRKIIRIAFINEPYSSQSHSPTPSPSQTHSYGSDNQA